MKISGDKHLTKKILLVRFDETYSDIPETTGGFELRTLCKQEQQPNPLSHKIDSWKFPGGVQRKCYFVLKFLKHVLGSLQRCRILVK